MNGYPRMFNVEADPREEHNIGEMYMGSGALAEDRGRIQGKPREK